MIFQAKTQANFFSVELAPSPKKFEVEDAIKHHLRRGHKKRADPYNDPDIVVSSRSLYKCRVCGDELTRNRQAIREHVRRAHKLTFVAYERSYEAEDGTHSEVMGQHGERGM